MKIVDYDLQPHVEDAREVLRNNQLNGSTKPAPHLYPHQWNWDSGFIAIGYANYDTRAAMEELTTLFKAQWSNGMLPQIVFNPDSLGGYFPEPDFWCCERSPHYPQECYTSGITMPPVHAIAARIIYDRADDKSEVIDWLKEMFPRLYKLHEYFHRDRDPEDEGLVYIRHPWESGLDNSPTWDEPLHAIELDGLEIPEYKRMDLDKGIPETQRPTNDDYDRYVHLVDIYRKNDYDEAKIYQECPFLIQDPMLNAILSRADEDLAFIAGLIGEDEDQLNKWHTRANRQLREKLWDPDHGAFDAYDLHADKRIEVITASGFMPLICGAPTAEEAEKIYEFLESNSFCEMHNDNCFSIPNYNMTHDDFDNQNYWRGPVWINTNWMLMCGLNRYGFKEKAVSVKRDIIELIHRWGFHEYFDPFEGQGYGTDGFSWSAALFLDVAIGEIAAERVRKQKQ